MLEQHAREKWDAVLHFMVRVVNVGSMMAKVGSTALAEPPASVIQILLKTELMQTSENKNTLHITDKGYDFMLKDIHEQVV